MGEGAVTKDGKKLKQIQSKEQNKSLGITQQWVGLYGNRRTF